MRNRIFLFGVLVTFVALSCRGADEKFDVLEVRSEVYRNVTVLTKTPYDVFITHAQGMANIKVRDLDNALRLKLGYEPDPNQGRKGSQLAQFEGDPRVAAMQEQITEDLKAQIGGVARNFLLGSAAISLLFYFFSCYCYHLICKKAGTPSPLVWFPLLQFFPLFRAARMHSINVLGLFAPLVFGVASVYFLIPEDLNLGSPRAIGFLVLALVSLLVPFIITVVWCVRICRFRNKNGLLALFLIFPLTSPLAFLYLAFSKDETAEEEVGSPGLVSFS